MYENLSWIHDIHYIWGLPFCTPVKGTEFSMIRTLPLTPTNPHPHPHCRPLLLSLSLIPHLIHFSSTCPPFVALFHPAPSPFHPAPTLWSPAISSFHKSNFTSPLAPCPSITSPPLCCGPWAKSDHVTTNVGACWACLRSATIRWFVSFGSILISISTCEETEEEWGAGCDIKRKKKGQSRGEGEGSEKTSQYQLYQLGLSVIRMWLKKDEVEVNREGACKWGVFLALIFS